MIRLLFIKIKKPSKLSRTSINNSSKTAVNNQMNRQWRLKYSMFFNKKMAARLIKKENTV